ncbi:MAG: hypothetical protein HOP08_02025 [Cyclobacteriaceae bacterium]|nr:hypothetical protein [Cyclobacteriaceae bacterium]
MNKFATENGWATREKYNIQIAKDANSNVLSNTLDFKKKNGTIVSVHMINMNQNDASARRFRTDKAFIPTISPLLKTKK